MIAITILSLAAFLVFAARRALVYLHMFQQEEYDTLRFRRWLFRYLAFDFRVSILLLVLQAMILMAGYIPGFDGAHLLIFVAPVFLAFAFVEKNPLKEAKKPLVLTQRAKRLLALSFVLAALAGIGTGVFIPATWHPLWWFLAVHFIPFALILAEYCLKPIQERINETYRDEARKILKEVDPVTIGITGSYGKTSVKHILGHILQAHAPTLITPGSVNTDMGNTRILREQLAPHHKYLVVEMGAYGPGSIARLCRLTPPDYAVITAIGPAHYERFKTLEQTAKAKFELAQAAIAEKGEVIVHKDVLNFENALAVYENHKDSFIVCGENGLCVIKEIRQEADGICAEIVYADNAYTLKAPLYGKHHGNNIALSFTLCMRMGLDSETVITALKSVPQIAHRLEVRNAGNHTIIDDAFNSNPKGFAEALSVLDILARRDKGRRILVTPGMVELGDTHDEEHKRIAEIALKKTDCVLVVSPGRIRSFVDTYEKGMTGIQTLDVFDTFENAQNWLQQNLRDNDVVLLENDLPDVYERKLDL